MKTVQLFDNTAGDVQQRRVQCDRIISGNGGQGQRCENLSLGGIAIRLLYAVPARPIVEVRAR